MHQVKKAGCTYIDNAIKNVLEKTFKSYLTQEKENKTFFTMPNFTLYVQQTKLIKLCCCTGNRN